LWSRINPLQRPAAIPIARRSLTLADYFDPGRERRRDLLSPTPVFASECRNLKLALLSAFRP
jgi:hypothetical protein